MFSTTNFSPHANPKRTDCVVLLSLRKARVMTTYKPPPSKNRKRVGVPQQRVADFALSQDKNSIVIQQNSWKLNAIYKHLNIANID